MQPRSQVRVVTIGNLMVNSCSKSLRTTSLDSHSYAFANPVKRKRLRRGISDRETAKDLAMTAERVDQVPTRLRPLTAKTGGLADKIIGRREPGEIRHGLRVPDDDAPFITAAPGRRGRGRRRAGPPRPVSSAVISLRRKLPLRLRYPPSGRIAKNGSYVPFPD